jgi:predicted GTPase
MEPKERFREIVDLLLSLIDKLPDPPRESIKREFTNLREMIMESRPPRIMIIGRRGSGKSSLINAIFKKKMAEVGSVMSQTGKPEWYSYRSDAGSLNILDTRGLGDKSKPESANFQNAIDDIKAAIKSVLPDVILFLCKAKDVDSHIKEDIQNIVEIKQFISTQYDYDIPILSCVTQVDELDPIRIEPPYEDEIKQNNIKMAVSAISKAFNDEHILIPKIIPVSAYAEYHNDAIVYNKFWNIEEKDGLIDYLVNILPTSAQLEFARLAKVNRVQKKIARVLITSTATVCAGIAAVPVPVADIIPITLAQISMIIGIGYLSGRELSKEAAKEFLTALGVNVGAAFVLREAARALIKFVFPGGGNVISASVAFAGTWALGEAAILYFLDNKTIEEAKECFKIVKARREKEYD